MSYALAGGAEDLQRLQRVSAVCEDLTRSALVSVGVAEGWAAIECGCGPLGALPVLADLVGTTGRVVGVDFNDGAIAQAHAAVRAMGLDHVEVLTADVHAVDAGVLGGPFDVAYTRNFLMHQPDPGRTLAGIAELVRPGGWIVAQEPLATPAPRSHPDLDALGASWQLMHALLERSGVPRGSVDDLPRAATEVGLEVVAERGAFGVMEPGLGFDVHAATAEAIRDRAVGSGAVTEAQLDALATELRRAGTREHGWVTTPFFLELALRRPRGDGLTVPLRRARAGRLA